MPPLGRLLVITFIESFATTLIERGVYFYSHDRLGFTDGENLGLALGFGAAYALGALASHRISHRMSEKRLLVATLIAQFAGFATLFFSAGATLLVAMNTVLGCINGLKWPVIESYVNAGRTPAAQARAVGLFNISWAPAVAVALVLAGPLIGWWSPSLFAAAGLLNLVSLALVRPLERRPGHLAFDHPERPVPASMERFRSLLAASRWSMLGSYSLMWVLAALLPRVYADLDIDVTAATALSAVLDGVRTASFLGLGLWVGWHNRRWTQVVVIFGLPLGFFLTLFGPNIAAALGGGGGLGLATVLVGEVVFGVVAGTTYYAALYYAMVVKNAAVEAGGAHEGLIGAGFAIGPLAGLAGGWIAPLVGGPVAGMAVGIAPIIVASSAGAVWFLAKCGSSRRDAA
ncbi:MAG: MFS transporter [Planctomycetota bacterium]|nr:MFS transporter [Planctomycetota bacterium]